MANKLRATRILSIRDENRLVKTFTFKDKQCARAGPGQFLMLWIPGVDEIPLSILDAGADGMVSVMVKEVGEATRSLHQKHVGEIIGVRGPFGNCFTAKGNRVLLVGGGTGTVPLMFLARKLVSQVARLAFVLGAKTRAELLFMDELGKMLGRKGLQLLSTTEDGSCGIKGLCTKPLEQLLASEKFDMIYTCGPERMMRKVYDLAEIRGTSLEASLERLMRCAIGLCGSCTVGKYRVCRDGPVFTSEQLREVKKEFGTSKRDFDGRRIPLD